ncbi:MAG: hypothetical protein MRZ54_10365 [Clostridiales bacterium]|nr:hypothetical protein [Clostridiales bacterium]
MTLRLLDEVMDLGSRGAALFCLAEDGAALAPGARLTDARGNKHTVDAVTRQDGLVTLYLSSGDAAYFGRLFRDVRIDATLFAFEEGPQCP